MLGDRVQRSCLTKSRPHMRVGQGKDGAAVVFPQPPKNSSSPDDSFLDRGSRHEKFAQANLVVPRRRFMSGGRSPGAPSSSAGGVF